MTRKEYFNANPEATFQDYSDYLKNVIIQVTLNAQNTKYTVSSQCPTTGRFLDNAWYDSQSDAQIHYDAFDINCRNKFQKIVTNGNSDVYTQIECNFE